MVCDAGREPTGLALTRYDEMLGTFPKISILLSPSVPSGLLFKDGTTLVPTERIYHSLR
jgi:hypothetical protein